MRTLIVSDLHLGGGHALLGHGSRYSSALAAAVADADRVVLLGDVLELRRAPWRDVLGVALPVLSALVERMSPEAEIVVVPGNHDHALVAPWLERRLLAADGAVAPLGLAAAVVWDEGDLLARVVGALGRRPVRVSYPGVWLRDDVYATHGHYLDRHTTVPIVERLGIAASARMIGGRAAGDAACGPASSEDYEAVLGPVYAWLDAAARGGRAAPRGASAAGWRALVGDGRVSVRRRALRAAFGVAVAAANRAGFGPLRADLSARALREAPLEALGEVLARLEVDAGWVVFGHTHRAGPLLGDDPGPWRAPTGARLVNCGCWVQGSAGGEPHPAGFCVLLDADGSDPELVDLVG